MNKRGSIINGDLANIRSLLAQGMQSPSAEEFVHDGELLSAALASAVHVGEDPGPELERASRGSWRSPAPRSQPGLWVPQCESPGFRQTRPSQLSGAANGTRSRMLRCLALTGPLQGEQVRSDRFGIDCYW